MAGEIFTSMEFRKFVSEDVTIGMNKISYLGYADYATGPTTKWGFVEDADKERAIWRIKKIVESGGVSEAFYPDADPSKTYKRSDRGILNYV